MTNLEIELNHLMRLLEPPYRDYWQPYCEAKARGLAKKYPEYAELPGMLTEALRSTATPSPDGTGGK